jgi:hypothetical protein
MLKLRAALWRVRFNELLGGVSTLAESCQRRIEFKLGTSTIHRALFQFRRLTPELTREPSMRAAFNLADDIQANCESG